MITMLRKKRIKNSKLKFSSCFLKALLRWTRTMELHELWLESKDYKNGMDFDTYYGINITAHEKYYESTA